MAGEQFPERSPHTVTRGCGSVERFLHFDIAAAQYRLDSPIHIGDADVHRAAVDRVAEAARGLCQSHSLGESNFALAASSHMIMQARGCRAAQPPRNAAVEFCVAWMHRVVHRDDIGRFGRLLQAGGAADPVRERAADAFRRIEEGTEDNTITDARLCGSRRLSFSRFKDGWA